jgi:hypothetical protein
VAAGLDQNAELLAAGWCCFWPEAGSERISWWNMIATVHGDRLREKWIATAPGTRPAFDWITRLPELELLKQVPESNMASRRFLELSGRHYWYAGSPWQRPQVELLREIGEVDDAEYRRHRAWCQEGCRMEYLLDAGWSCSWAWHGIQPSCESIVLLGES